METTNTHSSIKVEPWEIGDMLVIRHFTGTLLVGQLEARQLLALLQDALRDTDPMSLDEAHQLVADSDATVAQYTAPVE